MWLVFLIHPNNINLIHRGRAKAFADSFQKLYERCQKCVAKDGDYFEGQ
jgi:hypothetical protein